MRKILRNSKGLFPEGQVPASPDGSTDENVRTEEVGTCDDWESVGQSITLESRRKENCSPPLTFPKTQVAERGVQKEKVECSFMKFDRGVDEDTPSRRATCGDHNDT